MDQAAVFVVGIFFGVLLTVAAWCAACLNLGMDLAIILALSWPGELLCRLTVWKLQCGVVRIIRVRLRW